MAAISLHWLKQLRARWLGATHRSRRSRQPRPVRLQFFQFEERITPTIFTPTIFTDSAALASGSLRAAVIAANNDAGTAIDTIQLSAGTYSLSIQQPLAGRNDDATTGNLAITSTVHTLIIQGTGDSGGNTTTIDATGLGDRVFQVVNAGTIVEFQDLVIQGGKAQDDGVNGATAGATAAQGGGILDDGGMVSLTNVVLQNNSAVGGLNRAAQGGGIFTSGGSVALNRSSLSNNKAVGGAGAAGATGHVFSNPTPAAAGASAQGGAIYVAGGTLTLNNASVIATNQALGGQGGQGGWYYPVQAGGSQHGSAGAPGGSAAGGGIYATASTVKLINASAVTGNTATGGNGGPGAFQFVAGQLPGTGGSSQGGGIMAEGGMVSLSNAALTGNSALSGPNQSAQGGGLYASGGGVSLQNAALSGNSALAGAGMSIILGGALAEGGNAQGGGLYATNAALTLTGDSFRLNRAIAGGGGGGPYNGGIGGSAQGGGVYADADNGGLALTVSGDTFASNQAAGGAGDVSGDSGTSGGNGQGGGLYAQSTAITLTSDHFTENQVQGGRGGLAYIYGEGGGPGGAGAGGGVYLTSSGTTSLTQSNDTFASNNAIGGAGGAGGLGGGGGGSGQGGGFYATQATLAFTNALFLQNTADGGAGGNAENTHGSGGNAGNGQGGGLFASDASLNFTGSQTAFTGNQAQGGSGGSGDGASGGFGGSGGNGQGGGLFVTDPGTFTAAQATLANNLACGGSGGWGGAGYSYGSSGGSAGMGQGGGLYASGALFQITSSTFAANNALGGSGGTGGAAYLYFPGAGGPGGSGQGGGLFATNASLDLFNSTLAGNGATGGTGGAGGYNFNSFYASGGSGCAGGNAQGGGIYGTTSQLTLTNDTLALNQAAPGSAGAAGIGFYPGSPGVAGIGQGGGLDYETGTIALANTLVAANTALAGPDFFGIVNSSGHNLIGDGDDSTGFTPAAGDMVGTGAAPINAQLGSLQNNGGPTQTIELLPGSPALGAGSVALAVDAGGHPLMVDQRGFDRTRSGTIDIGAVEDQVGLTGQTDQIAPWNVPYNVALGTFADAAAPGPANVDVNWGDGSSDTVFSASPGSLGKKSHTYAAAGIYATTVTVTDATNDSTAASFQVTVLPVLNLMGPGSGVLGQPLNYSLSVPDASAAELVAGFTYAINWGDGSSTTIGPGAAAPALISHVYTNLGSYTVKATVTDSMNLLSSVVQQTVTIKYAELEGSELYVGAKILMKFTPGASASSVNVAVDGHPQGAFSSTGPVVMYGLGTASVAIYGGTSANAFTLDPTDVILNGQAFDGNGVGAWNLVGGPGMNTFTADAGANGSITGMNAADDLIGPDMTNSWVLTGYNQGTLNGTLVFNKVPNLTGGSGNDAFQILHNGETAGKIDGGGGSNTLDYSLYGQTVSVNLNTGSATHVLGDMLNIQALVGSTGGTTLLGPNAASLWQVTGSNTGTINGTFAFSGVQSIVGGTGMNTLVGPAGTNTWVLSALSQGTLNSTLAFDKMYNLTGGSGNDRFQIMPNGEVAGMIDGGGGTNTLDYSAYGHVVSFTLSTGAATRILSGAFNIQGLVGSTSGTTLTGPNTSNIWQITGSTAGTLNGVFTFSGVQNIWGGTGVDTVLGPPGTNIWTLTAVSQGMLNGALAFNKMENLTGGAGNDTFRMQPNGKLSGTIDGGGGSNTLDFTGYANPMSVNLKAGKATAITGGVANILVVLGSTTGHDTLTGGSGGSILVGFGLDNIVTGGSGGGNLLIGGTGADTLVSGGSGDILIGGSTAFDTNTTALLAILAEWQDTGETYTQRINHITGLTSGGLNGSYDLDSATVTHSSAADTLSGGTGPALDWFFAVLPKDTLLNKQPGEQVS